MSMMTDLPDTYSAGIERPATGRPLITPAMRAAHRQRVNDLRREAFRAAFTAIGAAITAPAKFLRRARPTPPQPDICTA